MRNCMLLLILILLLGGCSASGKSASVVDSSPPSNSSVAAVEQSPEPSVDLQEPIKNTVTLFIASLSDTEIFKELASDGGIDIVRFFVSGNGARGKDTLLHFNKDQIPSDLKFPFKNELPEDIKFDFDGVSSIDAEDLQIEVINQPGLLAKPIESLDDFWNECDELRSSLKDQSDDIFHVIQTKDSFALTRSETEFGTGIWAIFNKSNDGEYKLMMIAEFR